MPRKFFWRVFLNGVAVLLALLVVGGYFLDTFLVERELTRLGEQVGRYALIIKDEVGRQNDSRSLQETLVRLEGATKIRFTVVARDGRVLADSLLNPLTMENHSSHPEIAEALAGREGQNLRKSKSLGIDMLYVALPGDPVVRAALSVEEVHAVIRELQRRILFAAAPAFLLALAFAWVLAKSLTARIERMKRFASEIERGNYASELRPVGDDELSDMERSLVALRGEIRSKVEILKHDADVLSGLVEGLPHAVLLFAPDLNLTLANGPARKLFRIGGAIPAQLTLGESLRNPRILAAVEALRAGSALPESFVISLGEPPSQFEVIIRALPSIGDLVDYLIILRDITRETHLERVRSDFIVNLSHELRTPLTAIRGAAETLIDAGNAEPSVTAKFLETIKRNSLRLETLLRDVSDLARAESSEEDIQLATFDAAAPAFHAADLFLAEAGRKGISLSVDKPQGQLELVSDEGKIEQILINLLQNAVRYTPDGGEVRVSVAGQGGCVVYSVEDTGIGIPEADIPRVTERFYRVDPGRSRAAGGTGLGLSIVRHLVEKLGGTLSIRSEPGRGTRVEVCVVSRLSANG